MKNGLEVDAPMTKEIATATAWAIRLISVAVLFYGLARVILAIRWW